MKDIAKRHATYNATFLGQKTFLDTLFFFKSLLYNRYYDFKDKKLALRNVWLRKRVNTWELKTGNIGKIDPDNLNGLGTTYYVYMLCFLFNIVKEKEKKLFQRN